MCFPAKCINLMMGKIPIQNKPQINIICAAKSWRAALLDLKEYDIDDKWTSAYSQPEIFICIDFYNEF